MRPRGERSHRGDRGTEPDLRKSVLRLPHTAPIYSNVCTLAASWTRQMRAGLDDMSADTRRRACQELPCGNRSVEGFGGGQLIHDRMEYDRLVVF